MGIRKGTRGIVEVAGHGRVLVRCPRDRKHVLKRFKEIVNKGKYCWTTHTYDGKGPQFALKEAL